MSALTLAIAGLGLASLGLSLVALRRDRRPVWRFAPPPPAPAGGAPAFETVFDYAAAAGQAHSPAIRLREDGFALIWFQGSQEAQADVDIFEARLTRAPEGWRAGTPQRLLTRGGLGAVFEPGQLVVTLGNTIENEGRADALYATVVSVGGWAAASVAEVRMAGGEPARARKLNLSPLLNRSNLVKAPMVACADGSHALPAYFEMGRTYGLLVRTDRRGRVRDTRRIAGPGRPIQPMIVPLSETAAVAFLRDFDVARRRLLVSRTEDGGQSWTQVRETPIENPSSPVAALALGGERILMAVNDDADRAGLLRLTLSSDGGETWRAVHSFEEETGALRYPMLRRLAGGDIALSYSHGTKGGIRAHVFNRAWLEAQ